MGFVLRLIGYLIVIGSMLTSGYSFSSTLSQPGVSARIIGGDPVTTPYSWMVSLQQGGHFCGGVLIDANWVLTAAHCLENVPDVNRLRLVIGETNWSNPSSSSVYSADWLAIHPDYNPSTFYSDIAILHIEGDGATQAPIELASSTLLQSKTPGVDQFTVIGWGLTDFVFDSDAGINVGSGTASPSLQQTQLYYRSDSQCSSQYTSSFGLKSDYWDKAVCAGFESQDNVQDACQGDSGGPLFVDDNGTDKLIGLVSWGIGCANQESPGVYAEVSAFLSWIDDRQNGLTVAGFNKIGFLGLGRTKQENYELINFSDSDVVISEAEMDDPIRFDLPFKTTELLNQTIPANGSIEFTVEALGSYLGEHNSQLLLSTASGDDYRYSLNAKVLFGQQANQPTWPEIESGKALEVDWPVFTGTDQTTEHSQPWFVNYSSERADWVMQSGPIDDNQRSVLLTYVDAGLTSSQKLRFEAKVDAENFDDLYVFVDEVLSARGTSEWQTLEVPLSAGANHVLFVYVKNETGSQGLDAAQIADFRVCPSSAAVNDDSLCSQADSYGYNPSASETSVILQTEVGQLGASEPTVESKPRKKSSSGFGGLSPLCLIFMGLLLLGRRGNKV